MKKSLLVAGLAAAFLVGVLGTGAFSTPGQGVTSAVVEGRGTAVDKIKSRGGQDFDVVNQTITIAPGGHSGWHSHPGQAIVIVKAGTFTTYDAADKSCTPTHYPAGSVYVDAGYGNVHIARNEGTTDLELEITYIDVPVGAPFRDDHPAPGNCGF